MDFEAQLKCKTHSCEGVLTIPIKIVVRGDLAIIMKQCYKCKHKDNVTFPIAELDQWRSLIADLFNRCENCGMVISPEWKIVSAGNMHGTPLQKHHNFGLANPCFQCRRNGPKSVDTWLWSLLKEQPASSPKVPIAPPLNTTLFCRYCGSSLLPGALFCGECGAETDNRIV
jgi:hypothetical protein